MSKISKELAAVIANDVVLGIQHLSQGIDVPWNTSVTSEDLMNIVLDNADVNDEEVAMVEAFVDSDVYQRFEKSMADIVEAITNLLLGEAK